MASPDHIYHTLPFYSLFKHSVFAVHSHVVRCNVRFKSKLHRRTFTLHQPLDPFPLLYEKSGLGAWKYLPTFYRLVNTHAHACVLSTLVPLNWPWVRTALNAHSCTCTQLSLMHCTQRSLMHMHSTLTHAQLLVCTACCASHLELVHYAALSADAWKHLHAVTAAPTSEVMRRIGPLQLNLTIHTSAGQSRTEPYKFGTVSYYTIEVWNNLILHHTSVGRHRNMCSANDGLVKVQQRQPTPHRCAKDHSYYTQWHWW